MSMKSYHILAIATTFGSLSVLHAVTHTIDNMSDLPIHASIRYHQGTRTDKHRIEPHKSWTVDTTLELIHGLGSRVKGIDIRDADKNKMIVTTEVLQATDPRDEGTGLYSYGKSTHWRFTKDDGLGLGYLDMLSGGAEIKGRASLPCDSNSKECVVSGPLP